MNFRYAGKDFIGTRAEILEQLKTAFTFELVNGNFRYGHETIPCDFKYAHVDFVKNILISKIQDQVPQETYHIRIGDQIYHGTKTQIEQTFLDNIKEVDVIFRGNNQFELLGTCVTGKPGYTISMIRGKIITKVKRMIYDL